MLLRLQSGAAVASSAATASSSFSSPPSSLSSSRSGSLQFPPSGFCTPSSSSASIGLCREIRWRNCGRGDCIPHRFCCKASVGNSSGRPADSSKRWDEEDKFLQASLLVSETIRHYNLRKWGFLDNTTKWKSSGQLNPLSLKSKVTKSDVNPIGHGFLRRFHSPTIFLKISCDGDMILPIVVGEFAIEKLMDTLLNDQTQENPNQFQFMKNLVGVLGYEVKKVWITKRVMNTYFAQIFLGKTAEVANICIDSRPSDAIHVANGFKAPIYVSKEIVLKDAIRIVYGTRRRDTVKTVYDVLLDSATEGPDLIAEELDLVRKMNIAVMEERYKDAAMLRDKLKKLRTPKSES